MQRMFNLSKWTEIPSGKSVNFPGELPRKVVLDVNASERTKLYVLEETPEESAGVRFLALVEGRDVVEFYVNGPFGVCADAEDCWLYTIDSDGVTFEAVDPSSFAVVREKRARNLELEYMMAMMSANLNRRMELQADELARNYERMARSREGEHQGQGSAGGVRQDTADDDAGPDGGPRKAGKRGKRAPGGEDDSDPAASA